MLFDSMLRNKRGDSTPDEMIAQIHRSVFTVIVILTTFFIIRAFIVNNINVALVESDVLTNYPHFYKGGFSKLDTQIDRLYPGVIDMNWFTTDRLKLLKVEKPLIVGRFAKSQTIVDYQLPGKKEGQVYAYTDEERYMLWQPIAQVKGGGEGGKTPYSELRYVTLADGRGAIIETVMIASN